MNQHPHPHRQGGSDLLGGPVPDHHHPAAALAAMPPPVGARAFEPAPVNRCLVGRGKPFSGRLFGMHVGNRNPVFRQSPWARSGGHGIHRTDPAASGISSGLRPTAWAIAEPDHGTKRPAHRHRPAGHESPRPQPDSGSPRMVVSAIGRVHNAAREQGEQQEGDPPMPRSLHLADVIIRQPLPQAPTLARRLPPRTVPRENRGPGRSRSHRRLGPQLGRHG